MLGETVRTTRIRRGLTQAKLARLAGVSRHHLAALEKSANVSINVLQKIAVVLDLTEIDLGGISLRTSANPDTGVNVPLLADTLREARVDANRAQTLLARAEALGGGNGGVGIEFPKTTIRHLDLEAPDPVTSGEGVMKVPLAGQTSNGKP